MIEIIGQPGKPATEEQIEAYKRDCNGCFGAAAGDCQKCQELEEITDEQAIEAWNILVKYCDQTSTKCEECAISRLSNCGLLYDGDRCYAPSEGIIIPAIRGNTVCYLNDSKLKITTCGRREEAEKLLEEKKREKRRS